MVLACPCSFALDSRYYCVILCVQDSTTVYNRDNSVRTCHGTSIEPHLCYSSSCLATLGCSCLPLLALCSPHQATCLRADVKYLPDGCMNLTLCAYADVPGLLVLCSFIYQVEVDMAGAGSLLFKGVNYDLLEFHFHSPSEHTIAGQYYPLEAHLIHRATDGSLAAIGLLFKYGHSNSFLQDILGIPCQMDCHRFGDSIGHAEPNGTTLRTR